MDSFSYQCGVIDCFNEMVRAGLKPLALAHPCGTAAERDAFLPFCREICAQYGTRFFTEDDPLLTDLFPLSLNRDKFNILFYREEKARLGYLALKKEKRSLIAQGAYCGEKRRELACRFGALLGYPRERCLALIAENTEKE